MQKCRIKVWDVNINNGTIKATPILYFFEKTSKPFIDSNYKHQNRTTSLTMEEDITTTSKTLN